MSIQDDSYAPKRRRGIGEILLLVGLGVVVLLIAKSFLNGGGSSGGLFSGANCSTNRAYPVPNTKFKGVDATLEAVRCKDESDSGKTRPYVLVTVKVNGHTSDKSQVRQLRTSIRLDRRSGNRWQTNITPTDIPTDTGVSKDGSAVSYQVQRRWNMPRAPVRIKVKLVLSTDKDPPASVSHTFQLP